LVYTNQIILSIYIYEITDGIFRIKKKTVRWHGSFCGRFYWRNYWGIQTGIFVEWRDQFTIKIADEISDRSSPSVIPSAKMNISPLCRPSPPLFLILLHHPNSPLPNCKQPPKKKISPLLNTSYISLSFVVTTSVFWFIVDFIIFCK
jgi:hypothetical protein